MRSTQKEMKTPAEIHAEVGCEITLDDCLSLAKSGAKAFYKDDIENIINDAKLESKGGVCECYLTQHAGLWLVTGCGENFDPHYRFKHCPGCGKEIKIV